MTTMSDKTAADVAAIFGCKPRKVQTEARRAGVGYNLGGRAGWRFTDEDVERLRKSMAPVVVTVRRRSA